MKKTVLVWAGLCLATAGMAFPAWADDPPGKSYVALGDSYAYGYGDGSTPISFGDQGYVAAYGNYLAQQNNGLRPRVVNLAIPAESTASFSAGNNPFSFFNLNYASGYASQSQALQTTIAQAAAAGEIIDTVTIQLGGSDLLARAQDPAFLQADPATQQQILLETLGLVQANYTSLLTTLQTSVPQANVYLLGFFNPFAALDPSFPLYNIAPTAIQSLNQVIAGQAAAFGVRYVDLYTPFLGREAELTYILSPPIPDPITGAPTLNIHPNQDGYRVIAEQLVQASAVPEPGTIALVLTALPVLAWRARRRIR